MAADFADLVRDDLTKTRSDASDYAHLLDMIRFDWRREVLGNGLVVLLHQDPTTPLVHLSIGYRVGSMDEGVGQTGLAHMFEHLMFGGTKALPGSYITRMKNAGTIDMNAMTGRDITRYYQTVPPHLLDFALFAEADRMGNFLGSIDTEALERERKVILEEKKQNESQVMGKLYLWMAEGMLAVGHPYRHPTIGYTRDILGYTLSDVRAWYATHYAPSNAVLVLSGGIDPDAALAMVERHFGHIAGGPRPQRITARVETVVRDSAMRVSERIGVPGIFYQGWSTPSIVASPRESIAMSLSAALLAGGRSSVLHRHLVEERDVATQVSGFHMPGQAAGTFMVDAALKARADDRIGAAISEVVRGFADAPIPADSIALARSRRLVSTIQSLVSFERKAGLLLEGEILREAPDWFRKEAQMVVTIDEAEIRSATRAWLGAGAFGLSIDPIPEFRAVAGGAPAMPPIGDPAAAVIRAPEWEEATLSNGARVRLSRRPGDPTFHLRIYIDGGQADEPAGKEGPATLIRSMPEIGIGQDDGAALSDRLARAHLSFGMATSLTETQMDIGGLRGGLAAAAGVLADALLHPRYRTVSFERHMASAITNALSTSKTPQYRSMLAYFRALLGDTHRQSAPLPVSADLTVADVEQFHATLLRPRNAVILIAGDMVLDEVVAALEAALGAWTEAGTADLPRRLDVQAVRPGIRLFEASGQGAVQVALVWRTRHLSDAEHVVLSCLGHVLAGSFTSRANIRLREELSWTYGVQGSTGVLVPVAGPDYGLIRTSVNEVHIGDALIELGALIEGLRGGATAREAEIESFRRSERDRMARLNETPFQAIQTMQQMLNEKMEDAARWREHRDHVEALSETLVAGLAPDLLPSRDQFVITLTGDLSRIRQSLAAANLSDRIVEGADR